MAILFQEQEPLYKLLDEGFQDEQKGRMFPARDTLDKIRKSISGGHS